MYYIILYYINCIKSFFIAEYIVYNKNQVIKFNKIHVAIYVTESRDFLLFDHKISIPFLNQNISVWLLYIITILDFTCLITFSSLCRSSQNTLSKLNSISLEGFAQRYHSYLFLTIEIGRLSLPIKWTGVPKRAYRARMTWNFREIKCFHQLLPNVNDFVDSQRVRKIL